MRGIVSFTLHGDDPALAGGAVRQAILFKAYSERGPVKWELRFYAGPSVDGEALDELEALGCRVIPVRDEPEDRMAVLWKYRALRSDYDVYLFRDADCRLSPREEAAVDAFLASGKAFHVMRDHPHHLFPVEPGAWGCTRRGRDIVAAELASGPPSDLYARMNRRLGAELTSNDFEGVDRVWLWMRLWPHARRDGMIHSEMATTRFSPRRSFPSARGPREYVGKTFNADDTERVPWLADQVEALRWATRPAPTPEDPPARVAVSRPDKVVVKLCCGLGNNMFQILAGHALARSLAAKHGVEHGLEVVLPDPIDRRREWSIYEILGGHLRADDHYGRRHRDFALPDPADLPAVFPGLTWLRVDNLARPTDARGLADLMTALYFQTERYGTMQDDERYAAEAEDPVVGKVLNCYFLRTFYPFPMDYWYPASTTSHALFEPGAALRHYLNAAHRLDEPVAHIGVHIRNDQRFADLQRSAAVPATWYVDCVADALGKIGGARARVILVANRVAANAASMSASEIVKRELRRRWPELEITESSEEPYYVDFFLLRACRFLAISASTFSFTAGLTSPVLETMYVPNTFSERHFMDDCFPPFCAFIPDRPAAADAT